MTQEQVQLGTTLWNIANELRGSMDANDFKDYMLSFIFLKYLSDNYERSIREVMEKDKIDPQMSVVDYMNQLDEETRKLLDKRLRSTFQYLIKPEYLWNSLVEKAKSKDPELLSTLKAAFRFIENESAIDPETQEPVFAGLFSEVDLDSTKLGKNYSQKNELIRNVLLKLDKGLSGVSTENIDVLGDAYEYVLSQFASTAGRKAGEFYTPQQVSKILARLVIRDCEKADKKRSRLRSVLDFACGSGSLLLRVAREAGQQNVGTLYGQETNIVTYNLARMNMLLHGLKPHQFKIFHGDTLLNEWDFLRKDEGEQPLFSAVVANPPFSKKWKHFDNIELDPRFREYDIPPKGAADYAFLLHGLYHLADDGTMAIILPHGTLFRGGREENIRKKLLKRNYIDAIIGLPANLFYSTGISVCIMVLKKCRKEKDDILFINASKLFTKKKNKNHLEDKHVDKIVKTYVGREEKERFSRRVSYKEIEENDFNLNISRYVCNIEPEPEIDLEEVHKKLVEATEKEKQARDKLNKFLSELDLPLMP